MAKEKGYRELVVWKRAVVAAVRIYAVAAAFPAEERYALGDQVRRAAVSIASNIAEGHNLHSPKSFVRHLRYSRGSLAEVETQIEIATRVGYVSAARTDPLLKELDEISRMLAGLIRSVRDSEDRPN